MEMLGVVTLCCALTALWVWMLCCLHETEQQMQQVKIPVCESDRRDEFDWRK